MIPVSSNNHEQGCGSVSSNCVVWQGPDVACLNICKGDTVSDVVADLATKLCNLLAELDLDALDLTCLNLDAQNVPTDLTELIQVIIDKTCSLSGRCDALEGGSSGGGSTAEIVATLPVCLQYTNPENDLVTELPIDQYAELAAAKICEVIADITTLETTVNNHETRITTLEGNTVSEYTTPQITPSCVLPAVPTDIDEVIDELEDQFCTLNTALGGSTEILSVSSNQCDNLSTAAQLSGEGTMASIAGWNTTVTNLAQSLENMWLTICDMRSAIKTVQDTCCSISCSDVIFAVSGSFTAGTLTLDFTGTDIPGSMTECDVTGADLVISDGTNTYNTEVPVLTALSGDNTATVDLSSTSLNQYTDYTITITLCVTNGSITCNKEKSITVVNPDEEPAPTINYYNVQLCTNPGDVITASYSGTLNIGQAVRLTGNPDCYTVVDTAGGGATATVQMVYPDCDSCTV